MPRLSTLALAYLACLALSCHRGTGATEAAPLDEATAKTLSHAFLDAFDRADEDAFAKLAGPTLSLVTPLSWSDSPQASRDEVLKRLHDRRAQHAPSRTRVYGQERVSLDGSVAVFLGETTEHYPEDGPDRPARTADRWTTLVLARDGAAWKVAYWQWTPGGLDAERQDWDEVYAEGKAFNPQPSRFLVEIVKGRAPGVALDVAMGQGRNSLYLASQGWHVTGIDVSNVALSMARLVATERKLSIDALWADADTWDYGLEKWDLVAMIYAGCDARRVAMLRKALKSGGLAVVEGFHKDAVPRIGIATGELAALFKDGFTVVRDEVVEEVSDWSDTHEPQRTVHFAALKN
jgi:SAM-dependent methyltransferase